MLKKLMNAAEKEDWDYVDKKILKAVKNPEVVEWAFERGLENPDKNVRDLAATILEKAKISTDKFGSMRKKLYQVMASDINPYARFRSAFALAEHGAGEYKKEVVATLREAQRDDTVRGLASKYLMKIYSD